LDLKTPNPTQAFGFLLHTFMQSLSKFPYCTTIAPKEKRPIQIARLHLELCHSAPIDDQLDQTSLPTLH